MGANKNGIINCVILQIHQSPFSISNISYSKNDGYKDVSDLKDSSDYELIDRPWEEDDNSSIHIFKNDYPRGTGGFNYKLVYKYFHFMISIILLKKFASNMHFLHPVEGFENGDLFTFYQQTTGCMTVTKFSYMYFRQFFFMFPVVDFPFNLWNLIQCFLSSVIFSKFCVLICNHFPYCELYKIFWVLILLFLVYIFVY